METFKGAYQGECNRTACNNTPAEYYNYSTKKYYCEGCAGTINKYNYSDAMRLFGHLLCIMGEYKEVEEIEVPQPEYITIDDIPPFPVLTFKDYHHFDDSNKFAQREKTQPVRVDKKIGRNELCTCGSQKKYKNCCGKN